MTKLKKLLFSLFLILPAPLIAQDNLSVEIDPRMEALSIFYTLATSDTLDVKPTPSSYYGAVKKYFAPYKDHASLNWYRNLESWDGFDISSIGLFLTKKAPYAMALKPEVNYIKSAPVDSFLCYFNRFYTDAKLEKFLWMHQGQYREITKNAKDEVIESGILNTINGFYGIRVKGKFVIYLDLLNNLGSNAIPSANTPDQNNSFFRLAYLNHPDRNLTDADPVVFVPEVNVVTHEISHLFLKDFIPAYRQPLYQIRDKFLTTTKGKKLNESEWVNELDELLVRVCTAKILAAKWGMDEGLKEIENQSRHFKWATPLYHFFDTYTSDRKKYPTIKDFYPEIVNFLNTKTE